MPMFNDNTLSVMTGVSQLKVSPTVSVEQAFAFVVQMTKGRSEKE